MKNLVRHRWPALAAILTVACITVLTVVACKSASGSASADSEIKTPAGPVSFTGGVTWSVHNDTNIRFRLLFRDANGNVVGEATVEGGAVNATGSVPDGATTWEGTAEDTSGGGGGGGGGMYDPDDETLVIDINSQDQLGGQRRTIGPSLSKRYISIGGPLWFDRDSSCENAVYSFVVQASSLDEASQLARETIEAPIGSPIDSRVTVLTFFKAVEGLGSATLVSLAQRPFSIFEVDFNRAGNYAALGSGATQTQISAGLWKIEAPVSYFDINGYGEWNHATFRTLHGGNQAMQQTSYGLIHYE